MPAAIRKTVDPSAGHCFPPRPADTGSPNVWVNWTDGGDQSVRATPNKCPETQSGGCGTYDHYPSHCCGTPCHDGCADEGSPDVFVNCQPIHRNGDAIDCGDVANNGSPNVFVNSRTGTSYMIDNTAPIANFDIPDITPGVIPEGAQTNNPNNTFFEFHVVTHDTEEDSTEDPTLPPFTNPASIIVPDPIEEDQTPPPPDQPPTHTCANVEALPSNWTWQDECVGGSPAPPCTPAQLDAFWPTFASGFVLSTNFDLWDLTSGPAVSTYRLGNKVVSQKTTLRNLCFLAETILEPMRSLYGTFLITSGFRDKTGGSQHNKGQAVDIQFPGFSGQQYWDLAQNVRDNINFDQFILEYGGRNPWLHLSINTTTHRHSVLTQTAPNTYQPGLIRLV